MPWLTLSRQEADSFCTERGDNMRICDNGIYRDMTEEEIHSLEVEHNAAQKIADLKMRLAETDYKAIKYAEGLMLESEYAPIRGQRQAWRDEINRLEGEL